jgi:hypothetical protein
MIKRQHKHEYEYDDQEEEEKVDDKNEEGETGGRIGPLHTPVQYDGGGKGGKRLRVTSDKHTPLLELG